MTTEFSNERKTVNISKKGQNVTITGDATVNGIVINFSGQIKSNTNPGTYLGDFSYNMQGDGMSSDNIRIKQEFRKEARNLLEEAVADTEEKYMQSV
ncbi:hypothetical protein EZS27_037238 [termite gut metagenome]|uniref:Uncharacterized protein n=1 Tax=termite gut metagenome TaxID=433724 RepID=A0A5J4PR81_9ZZZZ